MKHTFLSSINKADLYILCWCIYMQQGALFSSGGTIFQVLVFLLLLISLFYAFKVISTRNKPIYFKGLNVLLLVMVIYGLLLLVSGEDIYLRENSVHVPNFNYLKVLLISLLPIYAFFYFCKVGLITERRLTIYAFIFVILTMNSFFFNQSQLLALKSSGEQFEITNNVGYVFVSLIPIILFVKNIIYKFILFFICIAFAYLSIKRGAILVGSVAGILFLLKSLKSHGRWNKLLTVFVIVAIVFGFYYLFSDLMKNNTYFQYRLEFTLSGEESARDIIYSQLWNHFINESTFLNMLFGYGAWSTTKYTMNYAHNDWLEILTDQGIFGIVLYLFYWFCFIRTWKFGKKCTNEFVSSSLLLLIVIYFIKSFFSMSFNNMEIYATLTLGYCLSQINNRDQQINSINS